MGKITDEQLRIIEKFSCERLSCRPENLDLIKTFTNKRGKGLVNYLQHCAWEEDVQGVTANYLIKSCTGESVMFFSLKCGALFDPLDEKTIEERTRVAQELLQNLHKEGQEKETAVQILERIRSGRDISFDQIKHSLKTNVKRGQGILKQLNYDKTHEGNEQIIRVGHTYPAVDLVNFCSNDITKDIWKECGIEHPMGEVMFWKYIVPIILKVQIHIGCQYVFLFAADMSEDATLINYYNVALKFGQPTDIGTNKPQYDLCCQFMCQGIGDLKKNQEEFFNNFNPDADDVIA